MLRLTLRNLAARKVRLLMSTLAIVLGIGFLTGVLTFSAGLSSTFDGIVKGSATDAVVRASDSQQAAVGGSGTGHEIEPRLVERLGGLPEVASATGGVDGFGLYVLDSQGKAVGGGGAPTLSFNHTDIVNVLGDPVLELDDGRWPDTTDEIALDTRSAANANYELGDTVTVVPPSTGQEKPGDDLTREFTLVGLANFNGGGTAGSTLVFFSREGAQELFLGGRDAYTSVSLTAAEGVSEDELASAARAVVPKAFEVVTGHEQIEESESTIGELLTIITAFLVTFAVIAVVVGGFIIANTFSILVAQRVRELALLRALGASRRQVTGSVLVEALLTALIGATIGIGVGLGLARALASLFRTFGLDINGDALVLTPTTVAAAYLVGVLITLASAYLPARRAAKVAPVAAMRDDAPMAEGSLRRRTVVGLVVILLGGVLAYVGLAGGPGPDAAWVGGAAVVWVLTLAFISPVVGKPVLLATRALFSAVFAMPGRLAGDNAIRNPRRTGATASALMIGLTLVSAVGVLAASLSAQTTKLVDEQFTADFLVTSVGFGTFPAAIGEEMADVAGVTTVSAQQGAVAFVDGSEDPSFLTAVDAAFDDVYTLDMVAGTQTRGPRDALLSETSAEELDASVGKRLDLRFPGGTEVPVTVVGIFADSQATGGITVPMEVLKEAKVPRADNALSILTDVDPDSVGGRAIVHADLNAVVRDLPIVTVQDKEQFSEGITGQVNQLLYMIYGLLALSVVIAVIGIINTLSLSVIERTREIGLLRAVGLSRRMLRRMITLESVTIALMGAVLGLGLGVGIGVLLQRVLREDLTVLAVPLQSLVVFLAVAVLFGVLAAVVPAVRASRMKVLDAISQE
ncbi:MAG: ABC transporter permease [Nocardioides sp.]|uniref:ABC transporter permease n=1 Tax=Nocardioides sp. TaxID=35761 RepID=UPI003EFCA290